MKRHLLPVVALSIAAVAPLATLSAQERAVPFVPFAGGGLAIGTGDLGSDTDTGWMLFGGVDVPLGGVPGLSVGVTGGYAHVPYGGGFGEATRVTTVSGEVGYVIEAVSAWSVQPYVRGGAGLHVHRYDPGSINARSASNAQAGFSLGGGVNIRIGATALLLGAQFVSTVDAGFIGINGGLSFPGIGGPAAGQ